MSSKSRRYSVIDSIEIAAPPARVLAALPDEIALGPARFSVEARTANGLALACTKAAGATIDCGGTNAWLAVAAMRDGSRVAVVHSQLSAKAYEALVEPWRAFLAKLAGDMTRDHAA